MAASAWVIFDTFKGYMADGTVDLDADVFYLKLMKNIADLSAGKATAWTQLTASEVTAANGYSAGVTQLTGVTWAQGASAGERRFDCTATQFSASGGAILSIRNAMIVCSTGELVCYPQLSTADFSIADGSSLTLTPAATGIFELN